MYAWLNLTLASLHWLHMCKRFQCPSSSEKGGLVIKRWATYKSGWLKEVYDLAVEVNAELLLFKTTNFVCDEKRFGIWRDPTDQYLAFDEGKIEWCKQVNEKFVGGDGPESLTAAEVSDYCKYGQFTEVGVKHLNDQLAGFVEEIHNGEASPGLTVGVFNDHDVEGCYSTVDSIHHKLINEMRIRLLSNTIESYTECGPSGSATSVQFRAV